jgi:hypothetical protein
MSNQYLTKVTQEDLFDLDGRLEKLKQKEVEAIILEVCADDRENQWKRKCNWIITKNTSQVQLDAVNQQKVDSYLKKFGIFLDAASVLCSVGGAFTGQPTGLFQVAAQAFNKTSEYQSKTTDSERTGYEHNYQRIARLQQDQSQQVQGTEREHEQMTQMIDRLMQTSQRTFELMASSGG